MKFWFRNSLSFVRNYTFTFLLDHLSWHSFPYLFNGPWLSKHCCEIYVCSRQIETVNDDSMSSSSYHLKNLRNMRLSIGSNFLPKSHVVDEPILVLLNLFGGSQSFWKKNGSLAPFLLLTLTAFVVQVFTILTNHSFLGTSNKTINVTM